MACAVKTDVLRSADRSFMVQSRIICGSDIDGTSPITKVQYILQALRGPLVKSLSVTVSQ